MNDLGGGKHPMTPAAAGHGYKQIGIITKKT